jgi:deoxyribodipyrimidine photo-lyase
LDIIYEKEFIAVKSMEDIQCALVWFKKDLRVTDHQPLRDALASNLPVIALYVREPSVMSAPDYSDFHRQYTHDCLIELHQQLADLNIPLLVYKMEMLDALKYVQ